MIGERSRDTVLRRFGIATDSDAQVTRPLPLECPIALEYCGLGYAVMMATPSDLEDFVIGHAVAEGLVASAADVGAIDVAPVEGGWVVRTDLPPAARDAIYARARNRVSDSSCGLCGIDSIAEALRPLPPVSARTATSRISIARALAALPDHQPLNRVTGAVHVAAFCAPDGRIVIAREDVGRHNALDKLIGAVTRSGGSLAEGFVLLSARCSFELVEKVVRAGVPMLVTISAPTSLAADRARAAGLTLVALARPDNALVVCDEHGMLT
jgi:FdhD protein